MKLIAAAAFAAAILWSGAAAQAATRTLVITGVGTGQTNASGPAGAAVLAGMGFDEGDAIEVRVTFDTAAGHYGSLGHRLVWNPVEITTRVNGVLYLQTQPDDNSHSMTLQNLAAPLDLTINHQQHPNASDAGYRTIFFQLEDDGLLATPVVFPPDAFFSDLSAFTIFGRVYAFDLSEPGSYSNADRYFQTTSVAFAVPEPATWALMIGGFGLAGVGLRRRKTVTA